MEVHARRVPKVCPATGSLVIVGTDRVGPLEFDSPGIKQVNRKKGNPVPGLVTNSILFC